MRVFWLLILFVTLSACEYFTPKENGEEVARVNTTYLYKKDIKNILPEGISKEDSAILVTNFINQWATKQLLIDQALINIPLKQQEQYNKLVSEYKTSLFTEAYKNIIVSRDFDSVVSDVALKTYYEKDKQNFILNDELLKVRYVIVEEGNSNLALIKQKLKDFTKKDQQELQSMYLQYKNYNLNDSTWIKKETFLENVPSLIKNQEIFKKNTFAQIQNQESICIIKVEDILQKNDIAPLSFITPTIKQIVLNKRKLELIKNIEKDITKDAITNNKFEIYRND